MRTIGAAAFTLILAGCGVKLGGVVPTSSSPTSTAWSAIVSQPTAPVTIARGQSVSVIIAAQGSSGLTGQQFLNVFVVANPGLGSACPSSLQVGSPTYLIMNGGVPTVQFSVIGIGTGTCPFPISLGAAGTTTITIIITTTTATRSHASTLAVPARRVTI